MSTPILSLQAESHIQPLTLSREYLTEREYIRLLFNPSDDHTIKTLGILNGYLRQLKSFIYQIENIILILDTDKMKRTPTSSTLIYPSWEAVNKYVVITDDEHRIYTHVEFQAYMD